MSLGAPELIAEGLGYLESPRWHQGELWFTDLQERRLHRLASDGTLAEVASFMDKPGGLGFLPDGDPLVVEMTRQRIVRVSDGDVSEHADLSALAVGNVNDLVTMADGGAFVGMFGYDLALRDKPRPAPLLHVSRSGLARVAADGLFFANGMYLVDDDRSLLVSETSAQRITRFRVGSDGQLFDRSIFAEVAPRAADGICVDADGGVWLASPFTSEFVRIQRGGRVTHTIPTPGRWAVACELGGADRSKLYLLISETSMERFHREESTSRVEVITAPVPGVLDH